jgi:hypothetical protein
MHCAKVCVPPTAASADSAAGSDTAKRTVTAAAQEARAPLPAALPPIDPYLQPGYSAGLAQPVHRQAAAAQPPGQAPSASLLLAQGQSS